MHGLQPPIKRMAQSTPKLLVAENLLPGVAGKWWTKTFMSILGFLDYPKSTLR
jgi:hypothetical protein